MSEDIRINRAGQPSGIRPEMGVPVGPGSGEPSKTPWIILGLVIVVAIILGVLFRDKLSGSKMSGKQDKSVVSVGTNKYQAIFLTNGQVYFGKLSETAKDFLRLTDIYYLQVVQPPLQGQQQPGQPTPQQQPQISLVKLGNELHGPVDEMKINKTQVLFYEDLKEEGQVVQAIKNYQTNPEATPIK